MTLPFDRLDCLTDDAVGRRLIKSLDHINDIGKGHMEEMQRLRAEAEEQGEDAVKALQERMQARKTYGPGAVSAEHDTYLEATIGHPQMLALARAVLGEDIRFDHQVALIKHGGHAGQQWHTHQYASGALCRSSGNDAEGIAAVEENPISIDDPELGFIRIFFYVNGFEQHDGSLKAISGEHALPPFQVPLDGTDA